MQDAEKDRPRGKQPEGHGADRARGQHDLAPASPEFGAAPQRPFRSFGEDETDADQQQKAHGDSVAEPMDERRIRRVAVDPAELRQIPDQMKGEHRPQRQPAQEVDEGEPRLRVAHGWKWEKTMSGAERLCREGALRPAQTSVASAPGKVSTGDSPQRLPSFSRQAMRATSELPSFVYIERIAAKG